MRVCTDALEGREIPVEFGAIEKTLEALWREQGGEDAVTRAALWNVLAHTNCDVDRARAAEVLHKASARVPQRSIIIEARQDAEERIAASIRVNCHMIGGGKQMYSEEISIVAGGDRIFHVPPLVEALLLANVPVVAWWLGDLPSDERYIHAILDPAERVVADSSEFALAEHFAMLHRMADLTDTIPADLNWSRLDEWRIATATIFDSPAMRPRLGQIRRVNVACASPDGKFANVTGSLLYLGWLFTKAGCQIKPDGTVARSSGGEVRWHIEERSEEAAGKRRLISIEIEFVDGMKATVERGHADSALRADFSGIVEGGTTVTRVSETSLDALLLRQLSRSEDQVFHEVIPAAVSLASKVRR